MTKVNAKTVLTRAQREALFRVFQRDFPGWSLEPSSERLTHVLSYTKR